MSAIKVTQIPDAPNGYDTAGKKIMIHDPSAADTANTVLFPADKLSAGSSPFTLLSGTVWDGTNKEVTLTSNLALTTTALPKLGLLKLKQDATGSRTVTLNGTSIPVSSASNAVTVIALCQDSAGNFFCLKDTSYLAVNAYGYVPSWALVENKVFNTNPEVAPWNLTTGASGAASISNADGGTYKLLVNGSSAGSGIAVDLKQYGAGDWNFGDTLKITLVIGTVISGSITVAIGAGSGSEFQHSETTAGTKVFTVNTSGHTDRYVFVGAGGALPPGNGYIQSIKIEKQ